MRSGSDTDNEHRKSGRLSKKCSKDIIGWRWGNPQKGGKYASRSKKVNTCQVALKNHAGLSRFRSPDNESHGEESKKQEVCSSDGGGGGGREYEENDWNGL